MVVAGRSHGGREAVGGMFVVVTTVYVASVVTSTRGAVEISASGASLIVRISPGNHLCRICLNSGLGGPSSCGRLG